MWLINVLIIAVVSAGLFRFIHTALQRRMSSRTAESRFEREIVPFVVAGLIAVVVFVVSVSRVEAQQMCVKRDAFVGSLTKKSGYYFGGGGMQSPESMLEVWVAPDTHTRVALVTKPNGTGCIVAFGEHWRDAEAQPTGEDG